MTDKEADIGEILSVAERIRAQNYPDIPADLIQSIVSVQYYQQDDRSGARKATKKLMDEFLKEFDVNE